MELINYQGIAMLSQAKKLPESLGVCLEIIFIKYSDTWNGVKSLSFGTEEWKGFDNFVSHVPGCNIVTVDKGNFLRHSILNVFKNWFCAALEAL